MRLNDYGLEGTAIFEIHGNVLDGKDITLFYGRLREYLNFGFKKFVIDLKNVERMNSVGLGMITSAYKTTADENSELVLANIEKIQSLLTITHLVKVFQLYDSVDEACNSFTNKEMVNKIMDLQ